MDRIAWAETMVAEVQTHVGQTPFCRLLLSLLRPTLSPADITNDGWPVAQPRFNRRPEASTITPWPSGKMKRSTCCCGRSRRTTATTRTLRGGARKSTHLSPKQSEKSLHNTCQCTVPARSWIDGARIWKHPWSAFAHRCEELRASWRMDEQTAGGACGLMLSILMPGKFSRPAMSISLSKWPMLPTSAASLVYCVAVLSTVAGSV